MLSLSLSRRLPAALPAALLAAALALAPAMVAAQALAQAEAPEAPAPQEPSPRGKKLQDELLDRFLKEESELNANARAAVEEMLKALGPIIDQFSALMGDLPAYEAPEILPNGDIIIRRKRKPLDPDAEIKT